VTTRHATPSRRTPTTIFQHLWRQTSLYARGTSPRRLCLNTLRPACRTTSTVSFSLFTPQSVPVIISVSIYPKHAFLSSRPLPSRLQHPSNNLRKGVMWGNAHIAGFPWAPTPAPTPPGESHRSYTSRTIATVRTRHETRPVSHQQLRGVQRSASFVSSAVYHWGNSVQGKHTSEQLMMWGRYPHIDTSPIQETSVKEGGKQEPNGLHGSS
jgi:hypothetical protein